MSTGLNLNCAKDNATNYSISTNLTTKLGAYKVAEDNIKMGLDLVHIATGSLSLIEDKLGRLRFLAVQVKKTVLMALNLLLQLILKLML